MSGMSQGQLPFKYLGVPLSARKLSVIQCLPLVKKILARVDCWASKLLTYAGRVQLIQSVLFGIQVYWSQIFLLPQKVIKLIQTACRIFLWTGKSAVSKRALVAWDKVCLPKNAGGLGLVNLKLWNKAAICKMFWNLAKKKDTAWVKWIHGYYIKHQDIMIMDIPMQCSWIIRKIMEARELFMEPGVPNWRNQNTFSIRGMYSLLLGERQQVQWTKLVSQNVAPPKFVFLSWLLMHGSLVTCEYLAKIGIMVDNTCCLCSNAMETLDHLFFGCVFAGNVWSEVKMWCGVTGGSDIWQRERVMLLRHCSTNSGKQRLYRCIFAIVVYHILKERNERRMQSKSNSQDAIVHQCKSLIAWCGHRNRSIGRLLGL